MSLASRLLNVFRGERLSQDLSEEVQFHIESRTALFIERGLTPEAAGQEARREFGSPLRFRERSRETKLLSWLESLLQDVRFGLRMLLKTRVLSVVAVLSLGLSIGAATAAFSLLDALMLRSLPVRDPDRLMYMTYTGPGRAEDTVHLQNLAFSYPTLSRLRETSGRVLDLFGVGYGGPYQRATFESSPDEDEQVRPQWISGDAFSILGIQPAIGRVLAAKDDRFEGELAAVLSYQFWMRRFNGDPTVVGQGLSLSIRGASRGRFRICGVAQKGFSGLEPGQPADLWFPITSREDATWIQRPTADYLHIWGRLAPGVNQEQARATIQPLFTTARRQWTAELSRMGMPARMVEDWCKAKVQLWPVVDRPSYLRTLFGRLLWILSGIVGVVLLIACANVANLFMARTAAREREMHLRVAIGAGRGRLVRQVLMESALVAFAACVLGLVLASIGAPLIARMLGPADFPPYLDVRPNLRVLGFLVAIGTLVTGLAGLAPALRVSTIAPNRGLTRSRTQRVAVGSAVWMFRPLLAGQVSLSVAVLFVAGLLLISFYRLRTVDPGFVKEGVLLATLGIGDPRAEKVPQWGKQVIDSVRQAPAVEAAALSMSGLVAGPLARRPSERIRLDGKEAEALRPTFLWVSPGFFKTMQLPLLAGRDFTDREAEMQLPDSAIVNQTFVNTYFPGVEPVGKRFEVLAGNRVMPQTIVGVVADGKYHSIRDGRHPSVFHPYLRLNQSTLEVRAGGDPAKAVKAVREAIRRVNPAVHITSVTLQSTRIEDSLLQDRLLALLSGFFAALAVLLAGIGLYGLLNYSVIQRTKEIGIRVALGARPLAILDLVVHDILLTLAIGIVAGLGLGLAVAPFLTPLVFQVKPYDVPAVVLPLACLLAAAAMGALPVALRAAGGEPVLSLRSE